MVRYYFLKRTKKTSSRKKGGAPSFSHVKGEPEPRVPQPSVESKGGEALSKTSPVPGAMEITFPSGVRPFLSWVSAAMVLGFLSALIIIGSLVVWRGGLALKDELLGQAQAATASLQTAADKATHKDFKGALVDFRLARDNFDGAIKKIFAFGQGNFYLVGLPTYSPRLLPAEKALLAGYHLSSSGVQLSLAAQSLSQITKGTGVAGENIPSRFSDLLRANQDKLISADREAKQAAQLLGEIDAGALGAAYSDSLKTGYRQAKLLSEITGSFHALAVALPRALGDPLPQSYLILFQNNNELRPSGGFIGSLAFLRLYKSKIDHLDVRDVYEMDGRLPPKTMPVPEPLKSIAPDTTLGIRDANWSADFTENARIIAKLYEKAGGTTVDGIITIDPEVLKDVLTIMGSIHLFEENITLTAENVVDVFQENIEVKNRFSEEPKAILLKTAPLILDKIFSANKQDMEELGKALYKRLVEKDILLCSFNRDVQSIISDLGWGGEISALGEKEDYLQVIKANLGANKTSQQVLEEIEHSASVDVNGKVTDSLKLTYYHQGKEGVPPPLGGPNKSYIRVLVPPGSRLREIQGFDEGTQANVSQENGRTVFSFWLTVNPRKSREVKISYTLPFALRPDRADRYLLTVQKQPGSNITRLRSFLRLPSQSQVVGGKNELSYQTLYVGPLGQDLTLSSVFRGK